jgi:ankyrin repeat protein
MPTLPAHPSIDHLRRQAKRLLRAARAGDQAAARQILEISDALTLTAAQTAVARSYGFASWPRLKADVEARAADLAERAQAFCEASIGDWTGRAARMLEETPELAGYDLATALVLGDVARVRAELERDPGLIERRDPRSGWTALHVTCASRWHALDPARTDGLVGAARLLLDAGADVQARTEWRPRRPDGRTPLGCAAATASTSAANEPLIALLLERGAMPEDEDLYLVGFAPNALRCLPGLLRRTPDLSTRPRKALAAPISKRDTEVVRLLLEGGVNPGRYLDDEAQPASALHAAIAARCERELIELLLAHGADPNARDGEGRSAYQMATAFGRGDVAALLLAHGARDDAAPIDRLLSACLQADEGEVRRQLAQNPGLLDRPAEALGGAIRRGAEAGNAAAVALMLDLGFPVNQPIGEDGGTLLHTAAYSGSADVVRVLLERGADPEAKDAQWESTALDWAAVGSGERPATDPAADWVRTVQILLEAGASIEGIELSPDDPKPPSPEVASLLRRRQEEAPS